MRGLDIRFSWIDLTNEFNQSKKARLSCNFTSIENHCYRNTWEGDTGSWQSTTGDIIVIAPQACRIVSVILVFLEYSWHCPHIGITLSLGMVYSFKNAIYFWAITEVQWNLVDLLNKETSYFLYYSYPIDINCIIFTLTWNQSVVISIISIYPFSVFWLLEIIQDLQASGFVNN